MTIQEAIKLPAGRDLDAACAEFVMGWKPPRKPAVECPSFPRTDNWDYFNPPPDVEDWRSDYHWRQPDGTCWKIVKPFSTDPAASKLLREKIRAKGWEFALESFGEGVTCVFFRRGVEEPDSSWMSKTEEHACAIAALKAVATEGKP